MSKFNVGDKVRIRKDLVLGEKYSGIELFPVMDRHLGKEGVITEISDEDCCLAYQIHGYYWTEEMLEKVGDNKKYKYLRATLYMRLPEDYVESDVNAALTDVFNEFGGQLIESMSYEENNLYSDDDFEEDYSPCTNDCFYF